MTIKRINNKKNIMYTKKLIQYIILVFLFLFAFEIYSQVQIDRIETNYVIEPSSITTTVDATRSIIIKPDSHFKLGSSVLFVIDKSIYTPPMLTTDNYIFSRSYQRKLNDPEDIQNTSDVVEKVDYYDGLGRLKQSISVKFTQELYDLVTPVTYDALGRQSKEYLSYTALGDNALYRSDAINKVNDYYIENYSFDISSSLPNPYTEKEYEGPFLNRVLKQAAPGYDWRMGGDHEIEFKYGVNVFEEVRYFDARTNFIDGINKPTFINAGYYAAGELYKNITRDENHDGTSSKNHTVEEFIDKQGRVVLKRTYNEEELHDTYYVYNDFGNLSFVLTPKIDVTDGISSMEFTELTYQYVYDYKNRLIEKKIPGKDWEYIVYNKSNKSLLTQHANQRRNNSGKEKDEWLFTKYDAFGRIAYTGIKKTNTSRDIFQNIISDPNNIYEFEEQISNLNEIAGISIYYTDRAKPGFLDEIHTINYYDDYNTARDGIAKPLGTVFGQAITNNTQGLPTVIKIKVLNTNDWITTLKAYDTRGRVIYVHTKNDYLNTEDIVETQLNFSGKILQTKTTHVRGNNSPIVTIDRFEYDHYARLIKQEQELAGNIELIVANEYDDLGFLVKKKVGNTINNPLQEVDYKYNIRRWLVNINNPDDLNKDLFAFQLYYNNTGLIGGPGEELFNGNISATRWTSINKETNNTNFSLYQYDALDRIVESTGIAALKDVSYDKNGNILGLKRTLVFSENTFFNEIDNLNYEYDTGNKLLSVTDNYAHFSKGDEGFKDGNTFGDDYSYDINGNMIVDKNKGVTSIEYNHLNLPTKVTIANSENNGAIDYVYDALGSKLKKIVNNDTNGAIITTDYAGNYIYENNQLQFFSMVEGYVEPDGNSYDYIYQYKDHLDNIRLSYSDDNKDGTVMKTEIREENDYSPFGLKHNNIQGAARDHKYGFGGKEEQDEVGLGWVDIMARNYDPAIGRWMNLDPLAEQMRRHSPYNYAFNNPVYFIDPDGMAPVGAQEDPIYDKDGRVIGFEVEAGQGPSQIAEELNATGQFLTKITFKDIIAAAPEKFSNVKNKNDINDPEFKKLNLNEGDVIDFVSPDFVTDSEFKSSFLSGRELGEMEIIDVIDSSGNGRLDSGITSEGDTILAFPFGNLNFNNSVKDELDPVNVADEIGGFILEKFIGKTGGFIFSTQSTDPNEMKRMDRILLGLPPNATQKQMDSAKIINIIKSSSATEIIKN